MLKELQKEMNRMAQMDVTDARRKLYEQQEEARKRMNHIAWIPEKSKVFLSYAYEEATEFRKDNRNPAAVIRKNREEMNELKNALEFSNQEIWGHASPKYTEMQDQLNDVIAKTDRFLKEEKKIQKMDEASVKLFTDYQSELKKLSGKAAAYLRYKKDRTDQGRKANRREKKRLALAEDVKDAAERSCRILQRRINQFTLLKEAAAEVGIMENEFSASLDHGFQKQMQNAETERSFFQNEIKSNRQCFEGMQYNAVIAALLSPRNEYLTKGLADYLKNGTPEFQFVDKGKEMFRNWKQNGRSEADLRREAAAEFLKRLSHMDVISGKEEFFRDILHGLLIDSRNDQNYFSIQNFTKEEMQQIQGADSVLETLIAGQDAYRTLQKNINAYERDRKPAQEKMRRMIYEQIKEVTAARVLEKGLRQFELTHPGGKEQNGLFRAAGQNIDYLEDRKMKDVLDQCPAYQDLMKKNFTDIMKVLNSAKPETEEFFGKLMEQAFAEAYPDYSLGAAEPVKPLKRTEQQPALNACF